MSLTRRNPHCRSTATEASQFTDEYLRQYSAASLTTKLFIVDDQNLATRCPLDNGRRALEPEQSLGQLDQLPSEVLVQLLGFLDLPTITRFRRVNKRATAVVDDHLQYRQIVTHCPDILRAIISMRARHYDLNTLFAALSRKKCQTCNRFGSYLYLITCERVCYECFNWHPRFAPIILDHAVRYTGRPTNELLRRLPHVTSLDGSYSNRGTHRHHSRLTLLDRRSVLTMVRPGPIRDWKMDVSTRGFLANLLFMTVISAPYVDHTGQRIDWGVYCLACPQFPCPAEFMTKYTADGILDHLLRQDPEVERTWHPPAVRLQ